MQLQFALLEIVHRSARQTFLWSNNMVLMRQHFIGIASSMKSYGPVNIFDYFNQILYHRSGGVFAFEAILPCFAFTEIHV